MSKRHPTDAKLSRRMIERFAAQRPEGYVQAYIDAAYLVTDDHLYLTRRAQRRMIRRYRPWRMRVRMSRWYVGPGTIIGWAARLVRVKPRPGCGCGSWRKRFNAAGWRGWWALIPAWLKQRRQTPAENPASDTPQRAGGGAEVH